mmetsp:Transcript_34478/g.62481  ORF Transcript_34478/g.62481 Transcript_34478/m.62481 type:complete len:731 (-) Transcript_34478:65-2257(-)
MVSSFIGLEDEHLSASLLLINSVKSNEQFNVSNLMDRGADVDFAFTEEPVNLRTPLRAACAQANVKVARLLLSRGADVFAHTSLDGWTALHSACHSGHDHVARMLIDEVPELHENTFHEGWSLMHLLALCMNDRLLDSGAALLSWAIKHMPSLQIGTTSQRPGYWDWTPLHIVAARGFPKACSVLLKARADVNALTADFHVRSQKLNKFALGDESEVTGMKAGFDGVAPQWLDKGLQPIHLAAFGGHVRTLQLLVRHGSSINSVTQRHCWTPLMYAVWSNNVTLVQEICRLGGRTTINKVDRRGDGSEWTPLAVAVVRGSAEMVQALVAYGADPLVRLASPDFPGTAFLKHCAVALADAPENKWSGRDSRISLLHLAVLRGCPEMLKTILPLIRATHFSPVRSSSRAPLDPQGAVPWQDLEAKATDTTAVSSAGKNASKGVTQALARALDSSKATQDRARTRIINAPASEGQDCDPVAFCTVEGWSPAVLAALLHTVDPSRKVAGIELLQGFPDKLAAKGSRADIFLELLATGRSLLEDRTEASPPTMPLRFPDVSQTLVCQTVNEFAKLCKAGDADRVAYRILHTTLCIACRFNRMKVVRHLLESGLCDPRCPFLRPIECRPLHIASFCGYGHLAQLLLDHKADPLEADEYKEKPVSKLTRFYERDISELQAKVSQLQSQLAAVDASMVTPGSSPKASRSQSPSRAGRKIGGPPVAMARFDSVLHDSRM